ncbi:unnamed protein product [Cunninghamella blakesleeana]
MKMKLAGSTCIQQPSSTLQSMNKYQKGKCLPIYYKGTEQERRRIQKPLSQQHHQQSQLQSQQNEYHYPHKQQQQKQQQQQQQQKQQQRNQYQYNKKKLENENTFHSFFLQQYKVECNMLGKGGYGVVLLARDQVTNQRCAVKFIYKNKIPTSAWVTVYDKTIPFRSSVPIITTTTKTTSASSLSSSFVTQKTCVPTEIYLLQKLNHPNIIKMFNVYQDDTFYYLVMETHGEDWSTPHDSFHPLNNKLEDSTELKHPPHHPHHPHHFKNKKEDEEEGKAQDLFECIEKHHHLSESIAQYIFKQIINTVLYLKQNGVYHRDIKDENILIDRHYNIKLIDFGSAIAIDPNKRQWISQFHGTLSFASPEILCGKIYEPEPAEVWSLGILLYTMLFGQVPFSTPLQVTNGHYHLPTIHISKPCSSLLNALLRKNPLYRPSIEDIANCDWLSMDIKKIS